MYTINPQGITSKYYGTLPNVYLRFEDISKLMSKLSIFGPFWGIYRELMVYLYFTDLKIGMKYKKHFIGNGRSA